jgi:hypothetical protein
MAARITGVSLAAVALMAAAVLWLWPASLSILGTDISCGIPAVTSTFGRASTADGEIERAVVEACVTRSTIRVAVGAGIGGIGCIAGLVVIVAGDRRRVVA